MFDIVRYEKVPDDIVEENETSEQEDDERYEAIIYLHPPPGRGGRDSRGRSLETWLRVAAALVLLAMVLGFVLCEWSGCAVEDAGSGGQAAHSDKGGHGHGHGHGHHHHAEDEAGDNDVKKEGDEDEDDDDQDHHHHDSHEDSDVHKHTHSGSLFHNAAIITPSATCSRAGRKLLQDGGNVVDAGIAALLCLGVVHPHTSGIGGTFSAVFYNHTTGSVKTIRPLSPKNNLNSFGIPAILPGIRCLHAEYGRLEWAKLFEEAIRLARDGFQIDHILSSALLTNERRIVQSKLCALFCDEKGRVKPVGSNVTNQNLSEVLHGVSLNESHFPEMLAMKLAGDLSPTERPDFVRAARRIRGEINDPLIVEEEKYTLFSGTRPFSGPVLSDTLHRATEQIHSLHNRNDLNSSAPSILSLLNFASEIYNATKLNGSIAEMQAVNVASSQIGVMHRNGHLLVISASLNSSWGSGRYLPSSGVVLSDFVSNVRAGAPVLNFPLVVKIKNTDDDDDGGDEADVQIVAMTGGLSALLSAAQILTNRLERGMSAQDSVQKPLFRFGHRSGGPVAACAASVSNGTDIFSLPLTDGCTDDSTAMLLRLHAGHVGLYGTPAVRAHTDGF
ncbi:hypothetical protein ACEWY4_011850 [Coilia grayii]|uniref:Uncharacterized protein n=1 Tax=Coilia grayii TaxID=363190 RepID=A0ABD1JYT3_9TELE